MLADMLKGITGQRLMQTKDDKSRVTACEIMSATGRIKDFIMDANQIGRIQKAIVEGEYYGMQTCGQRS